MFLLECPSCGRRELRSVQAVSSLANTDDGIELSMTCHGCGAIVHTLTGARAAAPRVHVTHPVPAASGEVVEAPTTSTAA